MNNCPHCNKQLNTDTPAFEWLESYGDYCTALTSCCSKMVTIQKVYAYKVEKSCKITDDWGNELESK